MSPVRNKLRVFGARLAAVRGSGRMMALLLACAIAPQRGLGAQEAPRPDSGSLVIITLRKARPMTDTRVSGNSREDRAALDLPVRGVVVTRPPSRDILGMSDGAGQLAITLPEGRARVLFSVEGFKPLRCQLEVRSGAADTVRAYLLSEDQVEAWNSGALGCRRSRP